MTISSPVFNNNDPLPKNFTCDGEGINPPLLFKDVPEETRSFVLIVDDPDAPSGPFTHWLVWNINHEIREVTIDSVPEEGVQGDNSAGELGWTAPCPPSGTHHYRFILFALNTILKLSEGAGRQELNEALEPSLIIEKAELIGTVTR